MSEKETHSANKARRPGRDHLVTGGRHHPGIPGRNHPVLDGRIRRNRQLLAANVEAPQRERLTLIRIFEELRGLGYEGGYDAVRRYARAWGRARTAVTTAAYVPLSFAPGEAYQFDWSHEIVLINGTTVTVKAAHVRLCHSRMLFVRTYPRETQEMVFDAHDRAFALF